MKGPYLIGMDLGTSVLKATLFDGSGTVLADAGREIAMHSPRSGVSEQRAEDYYEGALEVLRELVEKSAVSGGDVAVIAFDGQMAGAMGVDRGGKAITPWYSSSLDTRYRPYLKTMLERSGDRVIELNGATPYTAPRMMWWRDEHPELFSRIDQVMNLVAYVTGRLGNLSRDEAFIEASYLSWHGLADTRNRCWSEELAFMFDLPLEKLPRIVDACEVVGGLSKEAASFCGIPSGVPLVAGTGDQVATHIGAGVVEAGYLMDGAGTFSVLGTCVDSFFADTRHGIWSVLAAPRSLGLWYPIMYIGGGGLVHRWSAGLFFEHLFSDSPLHGRTSISTHYSVLDHLAGEVPAGSDGLIFVPHLYGRSCPEEPEMRGAWLGLTTSHTPAHLFRAVLESIAYDYAVSLEALRDYLPDVEFKGVRVTGGGAASHLWTQIKASVLGIPYGGLQRSSMAAAGSAMIGGHAVGLFSDIASVAKGWAVLTDTTLPRPRLTSRYRQYVQAYRQALKDLKGLNQTLDTLRNQPEDYS